MSQVCSRTSCFLLQVMVMADTSYHPLGVDEVAAQHADAQCVVSCIMLICGSSSGSFTWGPGDPCRALQCPGIRHTAGLPCNVC